MVHGRVDEKTEFFYWDRSYLLLEAFGIDSRAEMDPLNKFWYGRKKRNGKILKKWSK